MAVKPITIEDEYRKNPDIRPEDIAQLRTWLKDQPHLPGEHLTDVDLLVVYHCCRKSFEVTKQVLDLHFTLRTLFTQFFKDRAFDEKAKDAFNSMLFTPLSAPTVDGHRVLFARLVDPDPKNFNFMDSIRVIMMAFDLMQYEEGTWPGFVIVVDLDMLTLGHLARLDISSVKKVVYFLQECMLAKLKGVHFYRTPSFMDKVMALLKPFIRKDLLDFLHIHPTGSDTIFKVIPLDAFPKEEGGKYKDHDTLRDELVERLRANSIFFKNENRKRVNEALRKEKNVEVEQEFGGVQGSFKKLDID